MLAVFNLPAFFTLQDVLNRFKSGMTLRVDRGLVELKILIIPLGRKWPIPDIGPSHGKEHASGLIVDQTHPVHHLWPTHAETTRSIAG